MLCNCLSSSTNNLSSQATTNLFMARDGSLVKEDLRQFWSQSSKEDASVFLNDWMARARSSGIKMLISFSRTLEEHRAGILAYYDSPVSTGPLEGTKNKIKTLQKQAYGFRDMSVF